MDSTEERPAELGLDEAVALAVKLHRGGDLDNAEALYRRVLDVDPDHGDALGFLGIVSMHRGRIDEALALIRKAISVEPERADRYNNLGNVLLAAERIDDAVEAYEKALALEPKHADAYNNLGIIYRAQRRFEDSARAYERAIAIDPAHAPAYTNYGNLLAARDRMADAILAYSKALELRPDEPVAQKYLAMAYAALGQPDAAAAIYRRWLERDPGNPAVRHLLAACSGENVPPRATDAYIETTFDSFSKSFDARLASLEYRAPELIAAALRQADPEPQKRFVTLDAGCGTGLCGPLVAPHAARLVGVDLSAGMIEKARARGVYDEVVKAELTGYLGSVREAYDLIVSADTLVYFGVLDDVLNAASAALRPDGLLLFSLEKAGEDTAPDGYRLNPHGRYSHTRDYVERTLRSAGFARIDVGGGVLRQERGEPVPGLVVTARKHAGRGD